MLSTSNARVKICLMFLIVFMTISNSCAFNGSMIWIGETITDDNPKFSNIEKLVSFTDTGEMIIGIPSMNGTNPGSNESTRLIVPINDPDGIKNASLFWQYETINDTLFNTTMSGQQVLFVDEISFQTTGFITDTGLIIDTVTGWMYGDYTYEASPGEVISKINAGIRATGPPSNVLVYVRINSKNITTGEWHTVVEAGGIGSTEDLGNIYFTDTNLTAGYSIFAITYSDDKAPAFEYLEMFRDEYTAIIPAPNQPAFVTYNITAFDELNNSASSESYTYLADWAPEASINDVPTVIKINQDYVLNVTVSDIDGANTINKSDATAFYRLEYETEWDSAPLTHIADTSGTEAFFNGSIPMTGLQDQETNLYVMINVSDSVGGQKGLEGSSNTETVIVDSLAPRVIDINVMSEIVISGIENITLTTEMVNITAEFTDPTGIETATIFYSLPNGTAPVMLMMTNITPAGFGIVQSTFIATLPAVNETAFVEYYFETVDYFGNTGITPVNFYYADGSGPVIDCLAITPAMISNSTPTTIIFNTSDYSGLRQSIIYYSFDEGITWSNTLANPINYTAQIDYQEVFNAEDLPFVITDSSISYLPIEVIRRGGIDLAVLTVEFSHELSTDLRIWLSQGSEKRLLIFDRESGPVDAVLTFDLLELGFDQADFDHGKFTLEIEDFSASYSGVITSCHINLTHYEIPLGYQFIATIPQSNNDTTVYYYITMTDMYWNAINSSTFSYYSDGLAPNISVQEISSPLNMAGSFSIQVLANVTDITGLYDVEIYFKFSESDPWTIRSMSFDTITELYTINILVPTAGGTLTYKIRAYDLIGLLSESGSYEIEFTNGLGPIIEVLDVPYSTPLNMEGISTIQIRGNASDVDGTVMQVELNYKHSTTDEWTVVNMTLDQQAGYYYYDVDLPTKDGNLIFKITATDDSGIVVESIIHTIEFINAHEQTSLNMAGILGAITTTGLSLIGLGFVIGTPIYLVRKKVLNKGSDGI
ncbi:MAG: hypothetical protein ACFFD4_00225 [Candidatus Odinarchaeota archaeon]